MDVYAAREDPVPGVSGALVADAVGHAAARSDGGHAPHVVYEPSWVKVAPLVVGLARPGDLVLRGGRRRDDGRARGPPRLTEQQEGTR